MYMFIQVEAVAYYEGEKNTLTSDLNAEKLCALEKGLGTSFVTFSNPDGASE